MAVIILMHGFVTFGLIFITFDLIFITYGLITGLISNNEGSEIPS